MDAGAPRATGSSAAAARDDGYAVFAALTAIEALQAQGIPHARCVVLIETCEESGSPDLPAYVEQLAERLGAPDLVVCLDSGCGDYDQLWATTSLRGMLSGTLTVEVLSEGVHSGDASGIVPSSFRILRQVLDRLEDQRPARSWSRSATWRSRPAGSREVRAAAGVLGDEICDRVPAGAAACSPMTHGSGRGAAQQHVAADAVGHRRRRHARARRRAATCCGRRPR